VFSNLQIVTNISLLSFVKLETSKDMTHRTLPCHNIAGEVVVEALVDEEDYDRAKEYSWSLSNMGYPHAWIDGTTVKLHRFVMNARPGDPHVERNNSVRHDSRKSNLRFATNSQGIQNNKKASDITKARRRAAEIAALAKPIQRNSDGQAIIVTKKNVEIIVDDDDYYKLAAFEWSITPLGYAYARMNSKAIRMHRFIMDVHDKPNVLNVDHINHNILDNRKSNLREADNLLNSHNRISTGSESGYVGVRQARTSNKFEARVVYNHKTILLGTYESAELASLARDEKCKELFGADARLNNAPKPEGDYVLVNDRLIIRGSAPPKPAKSASRFRGCKRVRDDLFEVSIQTNKKRTYVGSFSDEVAAAYAYDLIATSQQGKKAKLNGVSLPSGWCVQSGKVVRDDEIVNLL